MKQKLLLSNLTAKQKQNIKDGSLSIAALFSGVGLYSVFGKSPLVEDTKNEIHPISQESTDLVDNCTTEHETLETETLVIETDAEFADGDYDALAFGGKDGAFAAARESVGPGGFFQWRGQTYNTYTQEEWDSMDPYQLNDYAANLESHSDYNTYEFVPQSQLASQSYDLNNDGLADVYMSDIDGDGVLDIEKVDLNSDGHLDVVHAQTIDSGIEAGEHVANTNYPEAEPVYGVEDLNEDGVIDAVVIDNNNDGYADTVIVDQNTDGVIDAAAFNIGSDQDLDILIVDKDFDDELDDNEIDLIEEELRMDEFIILNEDEVDGMIDNSKQHTEYDENLISDVDDEYDFEGIEL